MGIESEAMMPLRVLLLADDKPGHYHQSEGVVGALERLKPVTCRRLSVRRRQWAPRAILRTFRRRGVSANRLLSFGYGLTPEQIDEPDFVVSSGGETLFANLAAKELSGARNIFLGPVRDDARDAVDLIISSHGVTDEPANHVRTLQPNAIDPERLGRPQTVPRFSQDKPPRTAALLVGGDTRNIRYGAADWQQIAGFLRAVNQAWGTRWVVSSSRRTSRDALDALGPVLHDKSVVRQFLDYRIVGPSSLPGLLRLAEAVVVTADSSTMLSEAVAGRYPVVAVTASDHYLSDDETAYRAFIAENNWGRSLPISLLSPEHFLDALGDITPRNDNHLDTIAAILESRFPDVLGGVQTRREADLPG